MKSIKYGIMLLAAFASFSSCDEHDFLKEKPLDFYSPENSMETSAHFQSSLNYLYNRVRYQVCGMSHSTSPVTATRLKVFWESMPTVTDGKTT